MSELILVETASGVEMGRRVISPDERYFFYRAFHTGDQVAHEGKCYTIQTVAWLVPEQDLVLGVRFECWAPFCDD